MAANITMGNKTVFMEITDEAVEGICGLLEPIIPKSRGSLIRFIHHGAFKVESYVAIDGAKSDIWQNVTQSH